VEFHEKQGVEKFWLYFNGIGNEHRRVLAKYIESGLVECIDWPSDHKTLHDWNDVQLKAYQHCIGRIQKICNWCAFVDCDEFLFSPQGISLSEGLKEFERYSGVVVNWVMYGTSNVQKIAPGESTLKALVYRAPLDFCGNLALKSIVKPRFVAWFLNPHRCTYNHGYAVTENHVEIKDNTTPFNSVDKLRINHYWTRDETYFNNVKIPRRLLMEDSVARCIKVKEQISKEFDDCILNLSE